MCCQQNLTSYLTERQIEILMKDLLSSRVQLLDGFSYLEAFDVRACLNRVFGFGRWDEISVSEPKLLYAQLQKLRSGADGLKVAYLAHRRLNVRAPDGTHLATYEAAAVGGSVLPTFKEADCYDMALKTAESQALKRCAIALGSQFGLGLYADGSLSDPVKVCLVPGVPVAEPESHTKPAPKPREAKPMAEAVGLATQVLGATPA